MACSEDSPSLENRLVSHLAQSKAVLKSQQRHEIDETLNEREIFALKLLKDNPSEFLFRFGKYLKQEHLQYFYQFCGDPIIDFHLCEIQKKLNKHTSRLMVKNRRFAAMERMKSEGNYFNESEMKTREPLQYENLIGEEEPPDIQHDSFLGLLLYNMDRRDEKATKYEQQQDEDDAKEEFDSDETDEENEEPAPIIGKHKELLKQEFQSNVVSDFLMGKDKAFDYRNVDKSDDCDFLEIEARDNEERYFNEEDSAEEMEL